MSETDSNPSGINEGEESAPENKQGATPHESAPVVKQSKQESVAQSKQESGTSESVKQGSKGGLPANQLVPGAQTDSIANTDGVLIAWDVIEAFSRTNGLSLAAQHFKVNYDTIRSRKDRHKWKKIPDGRTLTKRDVKADAQLVATGADLSLVIDGHRARVYEKVAASIDKFKPKAPKNFKEFESADKIARRALGIDDDKQTGNVTLIKINEAIDQTDSLPHEIHEVVAVEQCSKCGVMHAKDEPCNSDAVKQLPNESVQQDSTASPPKTDAPAGA